MHVVVQIIVSLLPELDLLEVDLNANIAHIHILQAEVLLESVSALVGDVSESVQQFLSPILKERYLRHESLSQIGQQLFQRLAFLDFKEVLVVVWVGHVVEAKVAWTILRNQEFLCCANLIEKLC